jgi:hypothetical protein
VASVASSFCSVCLLCLGDHRFESGDDQVLLAVEVVDQHAVEGCRLVQEVASRILPESGAELMSEQPKPGVDPGHRCVELNVVVLQPDRVVLEGSHPIQQERVHHVVLGPVVVVDQTDDGRKGTTECRCGARVTIGQRCRGGNEALTVGTHRLVHRHQNAAVFGNGDELGAAHLGFSHAAPLRCSSGLELLACQGTPGLHRDVTGRL